ncbi:class I SAM-dependent methyltransferase [Pseudarthrobacter sp. NS4]|uniref:class I SAM-dependent methyltransferase n=1 Tax=Pseudarthrobacter sp. NS4 TaxID=2973976 RepID=UPI00216369D8|nr:methyltransferase domain-containing protein [Pseudarthrobacter sp. NS4]
MTTSEAFHLDLAAAEVYEKRFVPAVFAEWADVLVDEAPVASGQRVLDVGCGTGIAARRAADIAGPSYVTGLDINEAMLTVAARTAPGITWVQGDAGTLPFADGEFDVVLCQMALMFFPDPLAAVREMRRVTSAGGTIASVVPARLEDQPAYGAFVKLVGRHAGTQAMSLLDAYWAWGDTGRMRRLFSEAGLTIKNLHPRTGTARYTSAADFVSAEVESTPLMNRVSLEQYAQIREGAEEVLRPFTDRHGAVAVPLQALLVVALK